MTTQVKSVRDFFSKMTKGWLYWEATRQPDPRVTMYESQSLDAIEKLAAEAAKLPKFWVIYVNRANSKNWVSFDDEKVALRLAKEVDGVIFHGEFVKEMK